MPGIIRQRAVKGYDITLFEKLIKCDILYSAVLSRICVISYHLHAKSAADVYEYTPDFSRSNYTYRLSVKVKACQPAEREIELSCPVVCLVDPSNRGKKKCCCMLGNGIG